MDRDYLFVYGTLRRASPNGMSLLLARYAEFVEPATYPGRLYRVDYYPGAVPSAQPNELVHGEVYQLRCAGYLLACLDEYEECGPDFPAPTEYLRRKEYVQLLSGQRLAAWLYVFNRPTTGLQRIESGDFFEEGGLVGRGQTGK